jgi:hypothetical protein
MTDTKDTKETKLCPFRSHTDGGPSYYMVPMEYPPSDSKFGPCLEDKCQMWLVPLQKSHEGTLESGPGYCGLAGRP